MQMTTVYVCTRVIAETVASLPLHVYKAVELGSEKATEHPLYRLLHDLPNKEMTSFQYREAMMAHLLLWGNSYSQILRNGRGQTIGLCEPCIESTGNIRMHHVKRLKDLKGISPSEQRMIEIRRRSLECVDMSRNVQILRDFCAIQGAFPKEYWRYFEGKQRRMAQKDRERWALSTRVNTL